MDKEIRLAKRLLESKGYRVEKLAESNLYEMANISKDRTGLPYDIWIDSAGSSRSVKHNSPRIKVAVDKELIPISISEHPEILIDKSIPHESDLIKFIIDNQEIFLKHWKGEIDDGQIINFLTLVYKKRIPREEVMSQLNDL